MVLFQPHPNTKAKNPERGRELNIKVNQLVITRNPKMCNFLDYN
jgi:hypothetical protein